MAPWNGPCLAIVMGWADISNMSYLSDMPKGIGASTLGGCLYFLIAIMVFAQSPFLGTGLLVLPVFVLSLRIWFGDPDRRNTSALSYTLRYLWSLSGLAQIALSVVLAVSVVGGLAWISTEEFRAEATAPTFTERTVSATERAKDATVETTTSWFAKAKGWFSFGDEEETPYSP